jgi:hypothetical protein
LVVGGLLLPAGLARGGFADFDEQVFNQLGSLHLVEHLHADAKELDGQIFGLLLVQLVVMNDAWMKDFWPGVQFQESPLAGGCWCCPLAVLTTIAVESGRCDRSAVDDDRSRWIEDGHWLQEQSRGFGFPDRRFVAEERRASEFPASTWLMSVSSTSTEALKL